jgi:hypothetical protein
MRKQTTIVGVLVAVILKRTKAFNVGLLCLFCSMLAGCGGGPVVSAQSPPTYSDASLNGTYAISVGGDWIQGQGFNGIGTIVFNGAGAVTGGSLTELVFTTGPSCVGTLTGTYSVSSSGSGTAQITANLNPPCAGAWNGSASFNIEVSQSGESLLLASVMPSPAFTGTAVLKIRTAHKKHD